MSWLCTSYTCMIYSHIPFWELAVIAVKTHFSPFFHFSFWLWLQPLCHPESVLTVSPPDMFLPGSVRAGAHMWCIYGGVCRDAVCQNSDSLRNFISIYSQITLFSDRFSGYRATRLSLNQYNIQFLPPPQCSTINGSHLASSQIYK